jgi:truncated hemoglobin YjbI
MIIVGDDRVTLKEWLVHHTRREGVWGEVVAEFYTRAAADAHVAPYFAGVDLDDLRRHFLAALLLVADKGLTVGTVRKMHDRHAAVRNLRGEPITGEIYDRVVATLGQIVSEILTTAGFPRPEPVVTQLVATVAPLRGAIVAE